jgi:hypothetical protein
MSALQEIWMLKDDEEVSWTGTMEHLFRITRQIDLIFTFFVFQRQNKEYRI